MFVSTTSQHDTNPMRFNAGPQLTALASIHSALGRTLCWWHYVHRVHMTRTQCRLKVGPASPELASIHSTLGICWLGACDYHAPSTHARYTDLMPAQCWLIVCNVGTTPIQHCITTHAHQKGDTLVNVARMCLQRAQKHGPSIPSLG